MASNYLGKMFRFTTFGESHGPAVGVVIDGCPAGISLSAEDINNMLSLRRPGRNIYVSPRKEKDDAKIVSGIFAGKTTGAPITILIENQAFDSSKYDSTRELLKPGHADYTYWQKYGHHDYRGAGRASGRETAGRVAAAAVASKILQKYDSRINLVAYIKSIGNITANINYANTSMDSSDGTSDSISNGTSKSSTSLDILALKNKVFSSEIFCPDETAEAQMINLLKKIQEEGDSIGGMVEFIIDGLPIGLGDPIYEKFSAQLARAVFSIPAVKGFEIGEGFHSVTMKGSEYNDSFQSDDQGNISLTSNHSGGIMAGITTGMRVAGRVAFRPTPSISKPQKTVNLCGEEAIYNLPAGSMHDPCVAVRGVIVVWAMCILVTTDALLSKLQNQIS